MLCMQFTHDELWSELDMLRSGQQQQRESDGPNTKDQGPLRELCFVERTYREYYCACVPTHVPVQMRARWSSSTECHTHPIPRIVRYAPCRTLRVHTGDIMAKNMRKVELRARLLDARDELARLQAARSDGDGDSDGDSGYWDTESCD